MNMTWKLNDSQPEFYKKSMNQELVFSSLVNDNQILETQIFIPFKCDNHPVK